MKYNILMAKKAFAAFLLGTFLIFSISLPTFSAEIGKAMRTAKLEKESVPSVCVRDISDSSIAYSKNPDKLMHPASSLKVFTFAACLANLGEQYSFDTVFYADDSNNLYLKLGADPLLASKDLRILAKNLKENFNVAKIKTIYIDDSIIDKKPYPDGWIWDDFWPNVPRLSPYTLNKNTVVVNLNISREKTETSLTQNNPYKMSIINETTVNAAHNIEVRKDFNEEVDIINLRGTAAQDCELKIPVSNPKYYFIANLMDAFEKEKISYKNPFQFRSVPAKVSEVAKVSHDIKQVGEYILKNSDNFSSEIVFKVAGAKFNGNNCPGTTSGGIEMFKEYYSNKGLNADEMRISDASGVSRYNLFSTDWMSQALVYLFNNSCIKEYMAQPGEGTLFRRLTHLKGQLWAKTGTLYGVSSLTGYMKTAKGKELAFTIIISNFNKGASIIKSIEDDLLDDLYSL